MDLIDRYPGTSTLKFLKMFERFIDIPRTEKDRLEAWGVYSAESDVQAASAPSDAAREDQSMASHTSTVPELASSSDSSNSSSVNNEHDHFDRSSSYDGSSISQSPGQTANPSPSGSVAPATSKQRQAAAVSANTSNATNPNTPAKPSTNPFINPPALMIPLKTLSKKSTSTLGAIISRTTSLTHNIRGSKHGNNSSSQNNSPVSSCKSIAQSPHAKESKSKRTRSSSFNDAAQHSLSESIKSAAKACLTSEISPSSSNRNHMSRSNSSLSSSRFHNSKRSIGGHNTSSKSCKSLDTRESEDEMSISAADSLFNDDGFSTGSTSPAASPTSTTRNSISNDLNMNNTHTHPTTATAASNVPHTPVSAATTSANANASASASAAAAIAATANANANSTATTAAHSANNAGASTLPATLAGGWRIPSDITWPTAYDKGR